MELVVHCGGTIRCVYGEQLDLTGLGHLSISRASSVEPDQNGGWTADLSLVGGPKLGPFARRSQALEAETRWLELNLLTADTC